MIKQYKVLDRIKQGVNQSSTSVVKDIMEKFEKFGISPVFSRNGQIQTLRFTKPHSDEVEDFYYEIKKLDYSENDFWFAEYDLTKYKPNTISPLVGVIIVISKKSGISKEYNKTRWVADFIRDLKKGFYN